MRLFQIELLNDLGEEINRAIDRVANHISALDEGGFSANTVIQDAVCYNALVIAECVRQLKNHLPDALTNHPEFPGPFAYPFTIYNQCPGALDHRVPELWRMAITDLPLMRARLASLRRKAATLGATGSPA